MRKSLVKWRIVLNSSVPIRKQSSESWIAPDVLHKCKMIASYIYRMNHEDATESRKIDRDICLNFGYVSSGKTVASVEKRASVLLHQIEMSNTEETQLMKIEELINHINMYPVTKALLEREGGIKIFLKLREHSQNEQIKMFARAVLVILGYTDPVKGTGIRILSLDGGGTKGVISIEIMKRLEELSGQKIHEMFDLIVGTSTGALLAFLIGIKRLSLTEILKRYKRLSTTIFKKPSFMGTARFISSHAFYDTETLVDLLKAEFGIENCMIDSAFDTKAPKVAAVSTIVNHEVLQPHVFRNYCMPPSNEHNYRGSCMHKLWEALQATTAAPGFFRECKLGSDIHQDGGLLTNNPSALALHESKRLWPDTPLQTIISIGNGVYHGTSGPNDASATTLQDKFRKLVASATDVEAIHNILKDLLPEKTYFRFNPNLSANVALDESEPHVIRQLITDAGNYIDKYDWKYRSAVDSLVRQKPSLQCIREKIKQEIMMRC